MDCKLIFAPFHASDAQSHESLTGGLTYFFLSVYCLLVSYLSEFLSIVTKSVPKHRVSKYVIDS